MAAPMGSRPLRLGLLFAIAALVAVGGWWITRSGARVESEDPGETPPSVANPPAELAAPPGRGQAREPVRSGTVPGTSTADSTKERVVRGVRIKLDDGTDAPAGRVFCQQSLSLGSGPDAVELFILINHPALRAEIRPGAPVQFSLDPGLSPGPLLVVDVPGHPIRVVAVGDPWPEEVVIASGVAMHGVVVDRDGRPVPDLALVAQDRGGNGSLVSGDEFDLERRINSGKFDAALVHAESRTDRSGRFQLSLAASRDFPSKDIHIASGDPRWFISPERFVVDTRLTPAKELRVVAEPGAALDVRVIEKTTGEPVRDVSLDWRYPLPSGLIGIGFSLPDDRSPVTRLSFRRFVPPSEALSIDLVATVSFVRGRAPARTTVTIPAGFALATVDLLMEPELANADLAHVELSLPDHWRSETGDSTPWRLELLTEGERPIRADLIERTEWAATDRIDVDLLPGTWRIRLLWDIEGSPAYETTATLASRVTSRLPLKSLKAEPH